jgi:hypothetical protein
MSLKRMMGYLEFLVRPRDIQQCIASVLVFLLVLEIHPVYTLGGMGFENKTFIASLLYVVIVAYCVRQDFSKSKALKVAYRIILPGMGMVCLLFLVLAAVLLILLHVLGAPAVLGLNFGNIGIMVAMELLLFYAAAAISKKYWLVMVGAFLPCAVALVWGLAKLHS